MLDSAVVFRNNAAVFLIQTGKYQEAISRLSHSLKTYSKDARAKTTSLRSDATQDESLNQCILRSRNPPFSDGNTGNPYIYKQPILMSRQTVVSSLKGIDLATSILVFNLAVAHHLLSLEYGESTEGDSCLSKALILYELAIHLQGKKLIQSNYLFLLPSINNIAAIHLRRDDREMAQSCLEQVQSILMVLLDRGRTNGNGLYDGYYHNLSFFGSHYCRGAAAA